MKKGDDAPFLKKKAQIAVDDDAIKTVIIELQPASEEG